MRMRRYLGMLLCGTLTVGLLAGCSGNSAKDSSGASGGGGNSGGEVTWWTWSTEATDAFTQQIEYAKANNPDLNVNIEYTANTDYWAKLPVAIAGGTGPDLYQMTRPSFEMYAASNQAMDLTEVIENSPALQEYLDTIDPVLKETYQFEGKQMGIPITVECTAVAYNKDMFEAAGLPDLKEMEDEWTWEDLEDIAQQLTQKDEKGETTQYGFYVAPNRIPTWEMLWARGCEMFDETGETCLLDNPEIAASLQPLVDMYQDGVSPSVEATSQTSGDDMFISGKIGMIATGIWTIPSFNKITSFAWDVAELPFDGETGERISSSNVLGLIISPKTKNLDATVALLEQLVQPDCQKIFADTNIYIPALESVRESYFEGDVPENIGAYKRALDYVHPNTLTQFIPYSQFVEIYEDALKKGYGGEISMEDALRAACDKINQVMDENKAQFDQ